MREVKGKEEKGEREEREGESNYQRRYKENALNLSEHFKKSVWEEEVIFESEL